MKISKNKVKKVPFSKLSKAEKRVAIAKDVLQQIRVGKYIADAGRYIYGVDAPDIEDVYYESDIKKNFSKIKECKVCAMGACLMSATKFANKLKFQDIGSGISDLNNPQVKSLFKSIFSPVQLLLIERSFEGRTGGSTVGCDVFGLDEFDFNQQIEKCSDFYHEYPTDEDRLVGIMNNIIENKGTFKP